MSIGCYIQWTQDPILYMYVQVSVIAGLQYGLEWWNVIWYNRKNHCTLCSSYFRPLCQTSEESPLCTAYLHTGVCNCWTRIRTGTVEWTMEWTTEFLFTVDSTIAHCVLAAFIPFHSLRPQKSLLN